MISYKRGAASPMCERGGFFFFGFYSHTVVMRDENTRVQQGDGGGGGGGDDDVWMRWRWCVNACTRPLPRRCRTRRGPSIRVVHSFVRVYSSLDLTGVVHVSLVCVRRST